MFDWRSTPRPIIALAPMADMTDSAFCRVVKRRADPVIFREMVSSEALVRGNRRTREMARFEDLERPVIQQIFGSDPANMAEAARLLEEESAPDGLDINMGCPARKIVGNWNGASLMREPGKAAAIIRAIKDVTSLPLSVKTRLGWTDPDDIFGFIKTIETAGADLVTIHGRTKEQGYSGKADWARIGRAKATVQIPVLLNGDVDSGAAAVRALTISGCDGVMIGRAALGNPWIFRETAEAFAGKPPSRPSLREIIDTILEHAELHAGLYPGPRPLVTFRKHLMCYMRHFTGAKTLRSAAAGISTMTELESFTEQLPDSQP